MADPKIATFGMEGVIAERIRPPWGQATFRKGRRTRPAQSARLRLCGFYFFSPRQPARGS